MQTLFKFHWLSHSCPFSNPSSDQNYTLHWVATSLQSLLISSNFGQFFVFHNPETFEVWGSARYFVECLQFGFVWYFLVIKFKLCIFNKTSTEMVFRVHSTSYQCHSWCCYLHHLVKMTFPRFIHVQCYFFPWKLISI